MGPTGAPGGMGWIKAEDPFNTKTVCSPQCGGAGSVAFGRAWSSPGVSSSPCLMAIPVLGSGPDQVELWGLEGSYLFQLAAAVQTSRRGRVQCHVLCCPLSRRKVREVGARGHRRHPPPQLPWPFRHAPDQLFLPARMPLAMPRKVSAVVSSSPLVLRPHRTDLQEFRLWRLPGQQSKLPSGRRVQASSAIMCKVGLCEAVLGLR